MDQSLSLTAADTVLFSAINGAVASAWFDRLMLAASSKWAFVLPVTAAVVYALTRSGRRCLVLIILLGAVLVAPLDGSASFIKKAVARTRPCTAVPDTRIVAHCPGSPSFPSNHAANAFTLAALATAWRRRLGLLAFPYAAMIAYSRVHLGVHYPGDVAAGALLGTLYGTAVGLLLHALATRWRPAPNVRNPNQTTIGGHR